MARITSDCDAIRFPSIKLPESPRIVMRYASRASNGPNHLGLCALQVALALKKASGLGKKKLQVVTFYHSPPSHNNRPHRDVVAVAKVAVAKASTHDCSDRVLCLTSARKPP